MACKFTYNGKEYDQDGLVEALRKMPPTEAAKYIPGIQPLIEAPFKTTWPDLGLKRMLHRAATEKNPDGSYKYDALSWTPGEAQADRYDLSKQLSKVSLGASNNPNLPYNILAYGKHGETVHTQDLKSLDELESIIGKEPAQKLIDKAGPNFKYGSRNVQLDTPELKIGGEGMKGFYDKMLPDKANALIKKYGSRVVQKPISTGYRSMQAGPLDWRVIDPKTNKGLDRVFQTKEEADNFSKSKEPTSHVLPITPELRKAAEKGFPTFNAGGAVSRSSGGKVDSIKINTSFDIPWMSVLSTDGKTYYRDRSLPKFIKNNGKQFDIDKALIEHEKAEYAAMKKSVNEFKSKHGREPNDSERQVIYLTAHKDHGETAERKYVESHGFSWDEWNRWTKSQISRLEKKKATKTPKSSDVVLFPHGKNLGTTLRASGGRINFVGGRILSHYIDHSPSEAQKSAGNYKKAHVRIHGMDVVIENAKGSERSGIDKSGKKWSIKSMPSHYGYIKNV